MIRAYVTNQPYGGFGVAATICIEPRDDGHNGDRQVMRLSDAGHLWEPVKLGEPVTPTLMLDDASARALLDGLLRHYQGAEDTRSLRADLDSERTRTDTLISHLGEIGKRLAGIVGAP